MKFLTVLTVLIVAMLSGCATTSDIDEAEMRLNARIDAAERLIINNTQQVSSVKAIVDLQTSVVNQHSKEIIDTNVKIDRMFDKAMVK